MKLSSKMARCQLSPMRKFNPYADEAVKRGIKIYHLNIGQPDILTPQVYFDAIKRYADPVVEYAPSYGVGDFVDSVRRYFSRLGVELERGHILPTSGGSEALQMVLASILDDGDEIVIPEPYYSNYQNSVILAGASVRPIQTSVEDGYRYADREMVEACINEHTRAMLITNPGNPTGVVLSREELKLMLDIAREHELFIIFDEVYREFTYGGEPLMSALQFEGYEDNVVVIDSVSKRFSACGSRIGVVVSKNKQLMDEVLKWCQCRLAVSQVEQYAAAAMYDLDPHYFDAVRDEYRRRRDTMVSKLQSIPGVTCRMMPKGAFYVMVALPIDDAEKFQMWLLNEFSDNNETVMFACGESFYETPGRGSNEIRLAYVINSEDISRALDILAIALEQYNGK